MQEIPGLNPGKEEKKIVANQKLGKREKKGKKNITKFAELSQQSAVGLRTFIENCLITPSNQNYDLDVTTCSK